jgi:RNA polymerase sigma-70 factor (ECF subfamily)
MDKEFKEEDVHAVKHLRPVPDPPGELETLFREYHEMVFRSAYRVTGSAVDAEDVLQTVFLRIMRQENSDLSPNPGSYLHRAAINASLDLMRSRSRSKSVSIEDAGFDLIESTDLDPEARHVDAELRRAVRQSISRLGERAAEVCVLRYFEGYDNRQIAHMLGTSQMVVGVTLHRARTRLRKEMSKFLEGYHEANQ